MKVSVILCTFNRAAILEGAIESIARQSPPLSGDWEIIVVDNNSSDRTPAIVQDISRRYPGRLRYVFEGKQGLSQARNAGIRQARGEILIFVDDDVRLTPFWLTRLAAALEDRSLAGAGGRILPDWTCKPPRWLTVDGRYSLAPFAIFDLGSEAQSLSEPPMGANMAFRKSMFERYGYFRTDLGRSGSDMLSNEDTEFGRRLLKAGERLHYEPSAVVYHPVSAERLRKAYLLRWSYGKGRSDIKEYGPRPGTRIFIGGVPLYLLRQLARWLVCWLFEPTPRRRFQNKLTVWSKLGAIAECVSIARLAVDAHRQEAAG
jgi:glycosyltransferase involved in cell wall biosynthesis